MRSIPVLAALLLLSACASQNTAPEAAAPGKTAEPPAAKKGPQCYSSDHGKFFNVGDKASISGVDVVCKATSDNKAAQWMGAKH